jgi:hypothetical protein
MADYRKLIRQLAMSRSVGDGNKVKARKILERARQINPEGQYEIVEEVLVVNNMPRRVASVVNNEPDAARVEFGRQSQRAGSDGRGGLRPLGRATAEFKD